MTVSIIDISTITRVMASEPGRVLTYASLFSKQTIKSSPTSCFFYCLRERYLGPCQISLFISFLKTFCENSLGPLAINYFHQKSHMDV